MKTFADIQAEINALPCAILPAAIPPESILDIFGCHRSYIFHCPHGSSNRLRIYGFASEANRNAFVAHYAAEGATIPADDVTLR